MDFDFKITINRPVQEVYNFFWTLDERDFSNNRLVPVYEKITEGPRRVGSVIREVVKTQFFTMEVFSEIIEYTPNQSLGYSFYGSGMVGTHRYIFGTLEDRTELVQQVSISFRSFRRILNLFLPFTYARMAKWRLKAIKEILEGT